MKLDSHCCAEGGNGGVHRRVRKNRPRPSTKGPYRNGKTDECRIKRVSQYSGCPDSKAGQSEAATIEAYACKIQDGRSDHQEKDFRYLVLMGSFVSTCPRDKGDNEYRQYAWIGVRHRFAIHARVDKLRPIPKPDVDRKIYRVLVVDDSILPRAAARAMLSSATNLRLVGEASSGTEALNTIDALRPDLVLMDVHMPEMDGPATAKLVLSRHPDVKVVAWTVSESSDDLLRMMQVGCSGYVLKDAGPGELQRCGARAQCLAR